MVISDRFLKRAQLDKKGGGKDDEPDTQTQNTILTYSPTEQAKQGGYALISDNRESSDQRSK
jgi:hypothetical protein